MNKLAISSKSTSSLRFIKSRSRRHQRDGLTLIELLIAVGLTLIIIAAMIRAFKTSSESISLGRAKMDMHNKIRVVTETLRRDLQNATHVPNPRLTQDGYFEIVEGEESDVDHAALDNSFIGDHDDILALTVRSEGEPFRGRFNGGFVESYMAEVVWWVQHADSGTGTEPGYDGNLKLYRRVLLIRPTGVDLTVLPAAQQTNILTYYANNDVSVRPDGAGGLLTNSLADLSNRANRFAHNSTLFPHEFFTGGTASSLFNRALTGVDEGFDLMLDECVAFDVKVFDPTAEVFMPVNVGSSVGQVVDYDDPGFNDPSAANDILREFPPASNAGAYPQAGGYVNLGYDPDATDVLGFGNDRWFNNQAFENGYTFGNPATYCTWWAGYEADGLDQDADGLFDEGSDGLDNDNTSGIDDNLERETQPPYAYPIRSLEIRVRMIEKKTNQILQKSVRESFVPN